MCYIHHEQHHCPCRNLNCRAKDEKCGQGHPAQPDSLRYTHGHCLGTCSSRIINCEKLNKENSCAANIKKSRVAEYRDVGLCQYCAVHCIGLQIGNIPKREKKKSSVGESFGRLVKKARENISKI